MVENIVGELVIAIANEVEPLPAGLTVLHIPLAVIAAPLGADDVTVTLTLAPGVSVHTANIDVAPLS